MILGEVKTTQEVVKKISTHERRFIATLKGIGYIDKLDKLLNQDDNLIKW